jgi:tetratricopeptide (TPR) repeat protein
MAYARFPVVVGHYAHAVIESTEGQLDRLLKGALTARWSEGDYPGDVGESHIALRSDGLWKTPPGGVVLGLGDTQAMSPEVLRKAMAAGSLKFALRSLRSSTHGYTDAPLELGLCSLLIGINSANQLAVGNIVTALVEGVLLTNQRLRAMDAPVHINELELIELFEDVAIAAFNAARALPKRARSKHQHDTLVAPQGLLRSPDARFQRPAAASDNGRWQSIDIRAIRAPSRKDKRHWLQYGLGGRLAGVDDERRPFEASLIDDLDGLMRDGGKGGSDKTEVVNQVFHALVPRSVKRALRSGRHVRLKVDERAAALPWELLADYRESSGQEDPLRRPPAASVSMIRQFAAENHDRHRRPFSRKKCALVIGDPTLTDGRFGQLRGANKEAVLIAAHLSGSGFKVTDCVQQDGPTVRAKLQARSWGVVHIAAHGHFENGSPNGGVVVSDGYLSSMHFDGLDEAPSLVFLNCCWLGNVEQAPVERVRAGRQVSVSTAKHLIQMGCQAVVACAWPIGDKQSALWSTTFYDRMLQGATLGQATLAARQATFEAYSTNNTWAAYQVYGDPEFKLCAGSSELLEPMGRGELDEAVDQAMSSHRDTPGEDTRAAAAERLLGLRDHVMCQSGSQALALARIGEALFDLSQHQDALDTYALALQDDSGEAPVRSIQRLAQCHAELGEQHMRAGRIQDGLEQLECAQTILSPMLELSPNAERASLLGAVHKRYIEWEARRLRSEGSETPSLALLERMADATEWYRMAAQLAGEDAMYQLQVQAACSYFLSRVLRDTPRSRILAVEQARDSDTLGPRTLASFDERWQRVVTRSKPIGDARAALQTAKERAAAIPQQTLWDRLIAPDHAALRVFMEDLAPDDVPPELAATADSIPGAALAEAVIEAVRQDVTSPEFQSAVRQLELLAHLAALLPPDPMTHDEPGGRSPSETLSSAVDRLGAATRAS